MKCFLTPLASAVSLSCKNIVPKYFLSSNLAELLGLIKLDLIKLLKAEDCAVLVRNKYESPNTCTGLNPNLTKEDCKRASMGDLLTFKLESGVSEQVLKTGELYYSNDPRSDQYFSPSLDNYTPIFSVHNCTILRLDDTQGNFIGILEVINQENMMSIVDY